MSVFAGRKKTALSRAARLFKQRQFAQVISILEPQITSYRENVKYFFLLGTSCLHRGDYIGAYTYLRRCVDIDYRNIPAQLALAVVHLQRGESEESLRIWLEILQDNPQNRYARLGLDTARKLSTGKNGTPSLFEKRKELALIPSPGFYIPRWAKWVLGIAFVAGFVLLPAALIVKDKIYEKPEPKRPEIALIQIEENDAVLDTGSRANYMLTEQEIRACFEAIRGFLENYEDTYARREINRLLFSNAAQAVKDKARSLSQFIATPTFANFPESFSYQEVMSDPPLYDGCFVRWQGRVSNVAIAPGRINLDFLVGYSDQKVLHGIVPAWMEFAANLQSDFAYEVIAKIVLPYGRPGILMQIVSLHELGL